MRRFLTIFLHEVRVTFGSPLFLVVLFIVPAGVLFLAGYQAYTSRSTLGQAANPFGQVGDALSPNKDLRPEGYVDQAGLVRLFPDDFPHEVLIPFPDQPAAYQALVDEKISSYYVISSDYMRTGIITRYMADAGSTFLLPSSSLLTNLLHYNLADGDQQLLDAVENPLGAVEEVNLTPQANRASYDPDQIDNPISKTAPYLMFGIYYFLITVPTMMSVEMLARERSNRVMEVLITSASTLQILAGKFLCYSLSGVSMVLLWGGSAYYASSALLLSIQGWLEIEPFPPALLGWAVAYGLASYLVYSTLMMAVGVLIPNIREASAIVTSLALPMFVPVLFYMKILDNPHGLLALVFSFFPFTAPTGMVMRMFAGHVPTWQPVVSITIVLLAGFGIIHLTARIMRAQTLVSGSSWQLRRLLPAWLRREKQID